MIHGPYNVKLIRLGICFYRTALAYLYEQTCYNAIVLNSVLSPCTKAPAIIIQGVLHEACRVVGYYTRYFE